MNTRYYYNPIDCACKSVVGGIKAGEEMQINLFYLKAEESVEKLLVNNPSEFIEPNENAYLILAKDGQEKKYLPMKRTSFGWQINLKIHEIGLYFYAFSIENKGLIMQHDCGVGYFSSKFAREFILTVFSSEYKTPDWFKGGIMYQIFPDRFCKIGDMPDIPNRVQREWGEQPYFLPNKAGKVLNNDFFGGNLQGIRSKIPYLKDLGVSVIYLNPIFEAASNHRYDTSDYMKIDSYLGTDEDLDELISTAKSQGISIIVDGVFNHTGDDSVYFNKYGRYPSVGAYQSKNSPYFSWYSFKNYPDEYSSWWGIDILPELNEHSPEYQEFIFGEKGVLKNWLKHGISGYRLDVADELPDFFLKKLRKSVKEANSDAIIIGEVWEDASDKIAYSTRREYLLGGELDSVMNYPLKDAIISYSISGNALNLLTVLHSLIDHYPKETLDSLMNILGTHDTARILTVLGEKHCSNKKEMAKSSANLTEEERKRAITRLKLAVVLQYTMPGVPCIYYGDENGMEGFIDPFCRKCFDWTNLNLELIDFYKKLGVIRNKYREIFKTGKFEPIYCEKGLFLYKRANDFEEIYVYTNNSSNIYSLNLNGKFIELISDSIVKDKFDVKPYSYAIFYKIKKEKALNA